MFTRVAGGLGHDWANVEPIAARCLIYRVGASFFYKQRGAFTSYGMTRTGV